MPQDYVTFPLQAMQNASNLIGQKLVIATSNDGKYCEIMEVLHDLPYEMVSSKMLELNDDIVEDGETYEANARKKVEHYFGQTGFITLSEDSGIVVDALQGELGVQTRRWGAGHDASDEEWIAYFLDALKDVPDHKRTARFICCAALKGLAGQTFSGVSSGSGEFDESGDSGDSREVGDVQFFVGTTEGILTRELQAPIYKGLPISSCFIPDGFDKVYTALGVEEKNRISHRGKAMVAVREALLNLR